MLEGNTVKNDINIVSNANYDQSAPIKVPDLISMCHVLFTCHIYYHAFLILYITCLYVFV